MCASQSEGRATPMLEGVDLVAREAEQVVEGHRREGGAEPAELVRRGVEVAALVVRADDQHAEVPPRRGLDGRPRVGLNEVPVEVHVVELTGLDRTDDDRHRAVGGEAHKPAAPVALKAAGAVQHAAAAQRTLEEVFVVDAVDGEQVDPFEPQPAEGILRLPDELLRGGGLDFSLDENPVPGKPRQDAPELFLGGAVATGGLDVGGPDFEGALDAGLEVGLGLRRHAVDLLRLPGVLEPHAAAGEHRHRQAGAAEAPSGDGFRAGRAIAVGHADGLRGDVSRP